MGCKKKKQIIKTEHLLGGKWDEKNQWVGKQQNKKAASGENIEGIFSDSTGAILTYH